MTLYKSTDHREPHVFHLSDHENTIHPGSKPESLMWTGWWSFLQHESLNPDDFFLCTSLILPFYCIFIGHHLFKLLHGINKTWCICGTFLIPKVYPSHRRSKCRSKQPFLYWDVFDGTSLPKSKVQCSSPSGSASLVFARVTFSSHYGILLFSNIEHLKVPSENKALSHDFISLYLWIACIWNASLPE